MKSKFGMYEMEAAAERILQKHPTPSIGQCVTIQNMQTDLERTGFVELLDYGWIKSDPPENQHRYNGEFFLTKKFVERCEN